MKLRNIDFGNVLGASGVQGFFGEGYWFHKMWSLFGLDFTNMTFVAKTTTLNPCKGNMPLTRHYTPRNMFPGCVKVRPFRGVMLNSVGLSNPGISTLLGTGKWQERTEPFLLSVMSLAETPEKRLEELRIMVGVIGSVKDSFSAPFGLQINLSCPNTGHNPNELIGESVRVLEMATSLGVPVMPRYSIASAPIQAIWELNDHPDCDAICVSNTLPFGWQSVDWQNVWGSDTSPLAKLGGGGLSGKTLRPFVCEWITRLRDAGFTKPINGGGGILCPQDVNSYHDAGASSIFLGSVAVLRPWRVKAIINQANSLNWE
jgi:dihydroorotate dehydrogenase (NAD+) catalytic subunit